MARSKIFFTNTNKWYMRTMQTVKSESHEISQQYFHKYRNEKESLKIIYGIEWMNLFHNLLIFIFSVPFNFLCMCVCVDSQDEKWEIEELTFRASIYGFNRIHSTSLSLLLLFSSFDDLRPPDFYDDPLLTLISILSSLLSLLLFFCIKKWREADEIKIMKIMKGRKVLATNQSIAALDGL
jgi:hypothetical protein